MNKKVLNALLFGALVFASAGTFTSCKDYDDDIDGLNQRMDAVETSVASLKQQIEAGSVITNVVSENDGVLVTLSNGNSFKVKNGTNGTNGTSGSVVSIGSNGNWFIDGVDQGIPAKGQNGTNGTDGDDGIYFTCWLN